MGMMVTARKVEEGAVEVRYQFGLDSEFDRMLVINRQTLEARAEGRYFDSAASVITAKIVRAWRNGGAFPSGMIFAS